MRNNLWKPVAVLIVLTMLAASLAACGPTPEPQVVEKVVKETVIIEGSPEVVEKVVTEVVEKVVTEVVEKEVEKEVEKIVTVTPMPKSGGKIIAAMTGEPDMLDPQHSLGYTSSVLVMLSLFDTLVQVGPDGSFQPDLAESWEYSDDATTFTYKLREDVKFHDGTPFNAEAVKFSLERFLDPEARQGGGYAFFQPDKLDSIDVLDEYTVRIKYKEPFAPFMTAITGPNLAPVSPTAVKEMGEDFGRNPVGTGPFKFKEWVSGSHITVERNPDYTWAPPFFENSGPAYLDEITFRFVQDNQTRLAALETGEVDLIESVPTANLPQMLGDDRFQIVKRIPAGNGMILQINEDKWPGDMMEVRQAMNYAMDRVAINNVMYMGLFDPAYGPVSPTTPCYWEGVEDMYPYDLEKAKQILADAGFADGDGDGIVELDGKPLALDFYWNSAGAGWTELAEAVQAQMRLAGIDLVLHPLAGDAYFSAVHDAVQGMNFMWYERNEPDILRVLFHSDSAVEGGFNRAYYRSPETDQWLEMGMELGDPEERCEAYYKAQEQIMKDAAAVPVSNRIAYWGAKANLKGIVMPWTQPLYQDMHLEQ
jgi:peptide/nickel transport system substrate-binding protein